MGFKKFGDAVPVTPASQTPTPECSACRRKLFKKGDGYECRNKDCPQFEVKVAG